MDLYRRVIAHPTFVPSYEKYVVGEPSKSWGFINDINGDLELYLLTWHEILTSPPPSLREVTAVHTHPPPLSPVDPIYISHILWYHLWSTPERRVSSITSFKHEQLTSQKPLRPDSMKRAK